MYHSLPASEQVTFDRNVSSLQELVKFFGIMAETL
jgi:hypothetical protein